MDVLQDDEERTRTGERLEQAPHRPEEFLRPCGAATAEHAEALDDEGRIGLGSSTASATATSPPSWRMTPSAART